MRGALIAAGLVCLLGQARAEDDAGPLARLLAEARTTRALDRVVLRPRTFALRAGPALEQVQALIACEGRQVQGGLRVSIVFEQLEGETTRFDYGFEGGAWVEVRAAVTPSGAAIPSREARVDLRARPPSVTQRDAQGERDPVALPWTGDELGELFALFVLAPLGDCGLAGWGPVSLVQELALLGPAAQATPLELRLEVREEGALPEVLLRAGDEVSARARLSAGFQALTRLEFAGGLYAEPLSEADYEGLHHAAALKLAPAPTYAATDALRVLAAAERVYRSAHPGAGSLAQLGAAGLIDGELAQGRARGWRVELAVSEDGARWIARATPAYRDEAACFVVTQAGELVVVPELVPLDPARELPVSARRIPLRSRW
ncbi:MAG: hypothetical protein R3F62_00150 [Planctomycetota bacterium]